MPRPRAAGHKRGVEPLTRHQMIYVLSGTMAVVLGGLLFLRACLGGGLNEPCGRAGGCQIGLNCIFDRCVPRCRDDDDCPAGMRCGIMQLPGTLITEVTGPMLICLDQENQERQVQRSIAAGDNRLTALQRKRSETYQALQQLLQVEKWTLSDDDFDAAWRTVPETLRREKAAADLARLILTTAGTPKP